MEDQKVTHAKRIFFALSLAFVLAGAGVSAYANDTGQEPGQDNGQEPGQDNGQEPGQDNGQEPGQDGGKDSK